MIYNFSQIADASNIAEWLVIFNSWSNGIMMSVLLIGFTLVLFGIMSYATDNFEMSLTASTFIGALASTIAWAIQYNGMGLVPTFLPVTLGLFAGGSIAMTMLKGWMSGS